MRKSKKLFRVPKYSYGVLISFKEGRIVPRKGYIAKRDVLPDPIYNSKVVTKLINNIMLE